MGRRSSSFPLVLWVKPTAFAALASEVRVLLDRRLARLGCDQQKKNDDHLPFLLSGRLWWRPVKDAISPAAASVLDAGNRKKREGKNLPSRVGR